MPGMSNDIVAVGMATVADASSVYTVVTRPSSSRAQNSVKPSSYAPVPSGTA